MPCSIGVVTQQTGVVQTRMNAGFLADDDQRIHREQRAFLGWKSTSGAENREGQRTHNGATPCVYWGNDGRKKWPEGFRPLNVVPLVGFASTSQCPILKSI